MRRLLAPGANLRRRSEPRRRIIIEFLGPSGAGKTTLISRTEDQFTNTQRVMARNTPSTPWRQRLWLATMGLCHPGLLAFAAWKGGRRSLGLAADLAGRTRRVRRVKGPRIALIDEGPWHLVTYARARGVELPTTRIPAPSAFVIVDLDPKLATDRAARRIGLSPSAAERNLQLAKDYSVLVRGIARSTGRPIITPEELPAFLGSSCESFDTPTS